MNKIKYVYFDLGGVVILDFSGTNNWKELKNELGFFGEKEKEFDELWDRYHSDFVLGKKEVDFLLPLFREKTEVNIPTDYSLLVNGFVNRFEANEGIRSVIETINKDSRIGLLTNAYTGMLDAVKKRGILPKIKWDNIIDSSVAGLRKPDEKIYQLAEKVAGVKGGEILFIDNTLENLNAAKDFCGWQTFYYDLSSIEESDKKLPDFWHQINF
jgi:HAD superfamily hydrolase (TIGR01509 family)